MKHFEKYLAVLAVLLAVSLVSSFYSHDASELRGDGAGIVFVSTQGHLFADSGKVLALNASSGEQVWSHDSFSSYYDVDVVNRSLLLMVAVNRSGSSHETMAVLRNWREGETLDNLTVPMDTHDVDYLGEGKYLVADLKNQAYIYDSETGEKAWSYEFRNHFPGFPEAGGIPFSNFEGWTHLNDADLVMNGSAVLLSPRNFNRVILVNRTTKETIFTLGNQTKPEILNRQHNPTLISTDPFTVLVANSENDAVEEYRLTNGSWSLEWRYTGNLSWPRDADRLPNGHTIVVNSNGQKILSINPNGSKNWEFYTPKMPYDIETLRYGEEPQGPPLNTTKTEYGTSQSKEKTEIGFLTWIMPHWISRLDVILAATIIVLGLHNVSHKVELEVYDAWKSS